MELHFFLRILGGVLNLSTASFNILAGARNGVASG